MKKIQKQPLTEQNLNDLEWLAERILERDRNRDWVTDVEAFLEYRVPILIEEIRKYRKILGVRP